MIKYASEVSKEAQEAIKNINLDNVVTGEEFEKWLKKGESKVENDMKTYKDVVKGKGI